LEERPPGDGAAQKNCAELVWLKKSSACQPCHFGRENH
jgi:hypothetical protein